MTTRLLPVTLALCFLPLLAAPALALGRADETACRTLPDAVAATTGNAQLRSPNYVDACPVLALGVSWG